MVIGFYPGATTADGINWRHHPTNLTSPSTSQNFASLPLISDLTTRGKSILFEKVQKGCTRDVTILHCNGSECGSGMWIRIQGRNHNTSKLHYQIAIGSLFDDHCSRFQHCSFKLIATLLMVDTRLCISDGKCVSLKSTVMPQWHSHQNRECDYAQCDLLFARRDARQIEWQHDVLRFHSIVCRKRKFGI